jgi:hypothetical protein
MVLISQIQRLPDQKANRDGRPGSNYYEQPCIKDNKETAELVRDYSMFPRFGFPAK